MIKIENILINDIKFVRTYSDEGYKIKKMGTNEIYDEAIDIEGRFFTYEETNEKIENSETE